MATLNDKKPADRLRSLFRSGRAQTCPKNQIIQYRGDDLNNIYLIKKGFVKAYTILDSGDTRTLFILGPNDIFPIAYSLDTNWKNYKVQYFYQAMTAVEMSMIDSLRLKKSIDSEIAFTHAYLGYMAKMNRVIMAQLEIMKNKKAVDKMLLLLPYLIKKIGRQIKSNTYQFKVKLSHQEMADLSGVTRETTTTLINQLEKKGKIQQKKGKWIIKTTEEEDNQIDEF